MRGKILIKGGCVLTLGHRTQNYDEADVLIEDGLIAEVGPDIRARGAEQIEARDTIVMPGFVDAHRHAWKTLFRNFGGGGEGERPVGPDVYGPHYQPDDVYTATLIGLISAAEAGITTVADWSDITVDRSHAEAALSAHHDSGLRTVFVPASPAWTEGTPPRSMSFADAGELTSIAYGPPDRDGVDVESVSAAWQEARKAGNRVHVHVGRRASDAGVVSAMHQAGLLGDDVTLIHCTNLQGPDLDAIAESGARVVLTPSNEMAAGYGTPPIQSLIDRNIRPGLGVGNESEAPGDMFAQMRSANSIQHVTLFDQKLSGKAGIPNLLTTRDVIKYGTIDGARSLGLEGTTGALAPGQQADVVVLRADRPNIAPVNDPIGAVVWGMDTSNIDWVFVAGKAVVSEGRTNADIASLRTASLQARERIAVASGILVGTGEQA